MGDVDIELVRRLTQAGLGRAMDALDEARRLNDAGFPGPAFVWAIRSAEILLRDYVLTPHFLGKGLPWNEARERGSAVLGANNWRQAFLTAEQWYGPFDDPLTEDDRHAWEVWIADGVKTRHALVHGDPVHPPDPGTASAVVEFVAQMARWYTLRFVHTGRHPAGKEMREALEAARIALHGSADSDG